MAGPAAYFRQCRDPLPEKGRVHAGPGGRDGPDQVVAGHERERRLVVVPAAAHLLLGEGHPGGLHADHHLPGAGRGDGGGPQLQAVGLYHTRKNDLGPLLGCHADHLDLLWLLS